MTTPLAVYDVTTDEGRRFLGTIRHSWLLDWMASEHIDPTYVVRVEINADGSQARITEQDRDDHGRRRCARDHDHLADLGGCEVALREPYDVPIITLPPRVRKPSNA
jgi:hypothetical protein